MKKHLTILLFALLFLLVSAMSCEETDETFSILPCNLKEVGLYHWDNAGKLPAEPINHRVPKEAYLLEIRLLTEIEQDKIESYHNDYPIFFELSDPIEKIQIYTETDFNETFLEGAEVTSCFRNYPGTIDKYQQTDYTVEGGTISSVDKTNRIYKALMTIPQAGDYRFRVVLTKESGETIELISDQVSLY